jgi:hypothetical protein
VVEDEDAETLLEEDQREEDLEKKEQPLEIDMCQHLVVISLVK